MQFPPAVHREIEVQPYPLLFVTISGAHLYGFPSPDSDFDLRGVHVLPPREVMGLSPVRDTLQAGGMRGTVEMDLVTHDVKKFFELMLKKNGYVLEQLHSPIVLRSTREYKELLEIAPGCVTRHHVHHYLGFAKTQWDLFEKAQPRKVKPLLYVYRVLLTGIHLMRTGKVEANLVHLDAQDPLPFLQPLIQRKLAGPEHSVLEDSDVDFHRGEFDRLVELLKLESERSELPETPTARDALEDLLLRIRLDGLHPGD